MGTSYSNVVEKPAGFLNCKARDSLTSRREKMGGRHAVTESSGRLNIVDSANSRSISCEHQVLANVTS